jgi:hypothetical protein
MAVSERFDRIQDSIVAAQKLCRGNHTFQLIRSAESRLGHSTAPIWSNRDDPNSPRSIQWKRSDQ